MLPSITIREWTENDAIGVWRVLKDASFSNLYPSFKIAITRPSSIKIVCALVLTVWAIYSSFTALVIAAILYVLIVYLFTVVGTLYYLYGPTQNDMKRIKDNYFHDEDSSFWVAEVDGQIAATIGVVKKLQCHPNNPKVAWLRRVAVKTDFRGLGIAKKLVTTLILFCKRRNYTKIELITTEVHEPARNLYSKLGFVMTGYKPYKYFGGLFTVWTYEFEYKLK